MESTVHDVALVFEGGGMRNSYSAGALTVMLENGLYFDDVYGLSAGATNAIDYVSRDVRRAQASFTATLDGLSFRWWVEPFVDADGFGSILHGGVQVPAGKRLPFDFAACQNNPAQVTLQAIDRDTGETAFFAREDFPTRQALMTRVRASTSYPIVLPPTWVDGHALYDLSLIHIWTWTPPKKKGSPCSRTTAWDSSRNCRRTVRTKPRSVPFFAAVAPRKALAGKASRETPGRELPPPGNLR